MARHPNSSISVAVIGCGAQGLVAVKNMLEEGFTVTGFDQNDYVGGIWHYSSQNKLSTLPSTVVNVSRERACFTDFPFAPGTSFVDASHVDEYLNQYADHFNLRSHLRLSTTIDLVKRDDNARKWVIQYRNAGSPSESQTVRFDKLIVAVGPHSIPIFPNVPGKDDFRGDILHSVNFKSPSQFQGKRVMVVGVGNTAADTASALVSHAKSVFLAHRNGAAVLPRILKDGSAVDHGATYRLFDIKDTLDYYAPTLGLKFTKSWLESVIKAEWTGYEPQWRLHPVPSLVHQVPTISDTLIPYLRNGKIISTAAPKRLSGQTAVELDDGKVVEVDTLIYCTGYYPNYTFLGQHDPTIGNDESRASSNQTSLSSFLATPRLYQNVFSLEHPDSLAFVGIALLNFPAFLTSDLATMAIAQLWSERKCSPALPPQNEMDTWFNDHVSWARSVRRASPSNRFPHFHVDNYPWLKWVQPTIGANIDEHLGFLSLQAWRYWWQDRSFCSTLLHGIHSPHLFRLFDSNGRRKKWDGARAAIEAVNKDVQTLKAKNIAAMQDRSVSSILAKNMPADVIVSA